MRLTVYKAPTGPVDDLAKLKIALQVINNGNEPITLVTDPSSILSAAPFTEKFSVFSTRDPNKRPKYKGILAKLSLERAATLNLSTTLRPGEKTSAITHDLSRSYDFTSCGPGEYTFLPIDTLHAIDQITGGIYPVRPASTPSLNILISADKLVLEDKEPEASVISDPKRQIQLTASLQAAEDYANEAVKYLENISGTTLRFESWFGLYSQKRKEKLQGHFEIIREACPSAVFSDNSGDRCACSCGDYMISCKCVEKNRVGCCACNSLFAYVKANTNDRTIYLGKMFWDGPVTGRDSKAGTIIHELSHLVCQTQDRGYGTRDAKDLAVMKPDIALINADSHQYFAENNPYLN
ncbi:hypothetical protein AX14_009873 [Amanita brunnescens Koide BX004]|nr:hypothetical protein AX14_009873 [Amanita brunnescens Koide BX004]